MLIKVLKVWKVCIYFVIQSAFRKLFKSICEKMFIIKNIFMTFQNKRLMGIVLSVALLLSVPLIAMQFSNEVNWTAFDFIVAGVLLLGTGLLCELVMRKVTKTIQSIAICVAILGALFLVWAELAVGIFGTPFAGS